MRSSFFSLLLAGGLGSLGEWTGCAATRTSANYQLTAETLDAGGEHTSSANYTMDSGVSAVGAVSTAPSPAQSLLTG
jgi:hypothetical protein